MYPPPFFGPIHHSPAFPYAGVGPEHPATATNMQGMRPPMGGMYSGMPHGPLGMYGPHPGMMPYMGQGFMSPGMQASETASSKPAGRPVAPASRPKPINAHGPSAYPDARKDVRFAGSPGSISKVAPRREYRNPARILRDLQILSSEPGHAGFRYPVGHVGYLSQEHTPASSAMPSPAVDAGNPMDLCKTGRKIRGCSHADARVCPSQIRPSTVTTATRLMLIRPIPILHPSFRG